MQSHRMRGMEFHNAHARTPLQLAIVASLLVHFAVLFIGYSSPAAIFGPSASPDKVAIAAHPRLTATLATLPEQPATPSRAAPAGPPANKVTAARKAMDQRKLNTPPGIWAARSWTSAERADMDKFLNELAAESKPPTGRELSKRALATARQMGRSAQDDGVDHATVPATAKGKTIEPFSLEMYFDAFVRKLNRSAAFVKNDPRVRGSRKALVQISLNSDGSLKGYRVLRSGDQEAEIAYIKTVIDRAAPFSAFPPDIRTVSDSLLIMMCISPAQAGAGGGFSRSFGDQDCKD